VIEFANFTVTHPTKDELWETIARQGDPKYCFGLQIDKFDVEKDEYDI
jgi:hypothetical protein